MQYATPGLQQDRHARAEEGTASLNPSHHLFSLDVFRGIAVIAALFVSIWIFGGFSENQQIKLIETTKGFDFWLYSITSVALEGKMKALIAIVFGASMLLYLFKDRQRKQLQPADFFIRRQLWLMAFGLINAFVFLWTGDILFHLGLMGILLFPFVRLSTKGFMIAAIITTLIFSGKNYWRYADDKQVYGKYLAVLGAEKKIKKDSVAKAQAAVTNSKTGREKAAKTDTLTKKQLQEKQAWEGLLTNKKFDSTRDDGQTKAMRTVSYAKIWNHQMQTTQTREAQWTYSEGIWDLGSMMFLGMALFSFGYFDRRFSNRKYLFIALVCIATALLLAWFRLYYQQLAIKDYERYIKQYPVPANVFFPFEQALLAVGYASVVLLLLHVRFLKNLWKALAATGQMALTNYLLQSIICMFFFSGFGLGYFGRLSQWQLYVFAAEVILINIVFSVFWLRYYRYGPAEWLWRCLVYKTWLLNRKSEMPVSAADLIA